MQISYKLKRISEQVHDHRIDIECLDDLNATIDELFAKLQSNGQETLLEQLCPYFGVIWPSARALAEELALFGPKAFQGRKVLEIGCGLALPSLLAAKLGAQVTATDYHPEVPRFLRSNLHLNRIEEFEFIRIDWEHDQMPSLGSFDWIIASDVLYERKHPPLVAEVVARYISPVGRVLLTDPGRPYLQSFVDAMRDRGFVCETRIRTAADEPAPKDIFVLELRPSSS